MHTLLFLHFELSLKSRKISGSSRESGTERGQPSLSDEMTQARVLPWVEKLSQRGRLAQIYGHLTSSEHGRWFFFFFFHMQVSKLEFMGSNILEVLGTLRHAPTYSKRVVCLKKRLVMTRLIFSNSNFWKPKTKIIPSPLWKRGRGGEE